MSNIISLPRKRQLMMLIMLLCAWLPVSSMLSLAHSPLWVQQIEQQHHAKLTIDCDIDGQGLSHDDAEVKEPSSYSVKNHSNQNHDHDLPQIIPVFDVQEYLRSFTWQLQEQYADYHAPSARLERPPRLNVVA